MSTAAAQALPELSEAYFPSTDGVQLYMASIAPANAKAAVLVLHGYADHALRYRHVMEALAQAGYAAHALDYRGHGRASGRRGFVHKYSDFLGDLTTALSRVKAAHPGLPVFVLAHSHGSLVASTLLTGAGAPDVAGVILSSPYFRLRIVPSWFQLFQAKVVGKVIPFLSVKNPVTSDMLTHDPAMRKATDEDRLKHQVVTPKWFTESNAAQAALFGNASNFRPPLLMMLGADDPVADPAGGREFFEKVPVKDKTLTEYPGMLHEILNEVEREKPISEAIRWLDAHVGGAK